MAIDMCSESSAIDMCSESSNLGCSSPRISFSYDLHQTDDVPVEDYPKRSDSSTLDSNHEFDFCTSNSVDNEPSSADELFSGGLIRPLQLSERYVTVNHVSESKFQPITSLPPLPSTNEISKQEGFKQMMSTDGESNQKHQSKSLWGIKRSISLHSHKKSSFWSLPLLSRSNSTGSIPSSKQTLKDAQKPKQIKNSIPMSTSSSSSSITHTYPLKPPLKKYYGGSYGNGIRVSPVLNVPPPYISRGTANLLGLGSLFGNGKNRKNKK